MNRIPRFAHRSPPTPGDRFRAFSHPLAALSCLFLFTMAFGLAPPARAQGSDLVTAPVNPGNRISLTGRHPAWASAQNDLGAVPADLPLGPMELELARSPQQEQAYEQYLRELQDPASPYYHHWLSPTQIGQRFGASQHDLDAIANWLQSQNLHVVSVANSRVRIRFSGPASAVGGAFGAEMHYYRVDGEQRLSISAEPQIPAALAGIIKSISGLYTIKIRPMHISGTFQVPTGSLAGGISSGVSPAGTIDGSHFLFPSDFATIYDLPGGSITGAGQTIAIVGRSRVYSQDITNFQSLAGLTAQAPTEIVPPDGVDPGPAETSPPTTGSPSLDQAEATLDVSRTTSIAPGATIDLVVSTTSDGEDGIVIASEYIVDTEPVFAQIMNVSFGSCESENGLSGDDFWDGIFSQASMEGISVFVASGDAGSAGCDDYNAKPPASQILSINAICASSHATCVGGTEFADFTNPTQYWSSTNGTNFESALSYIPEGGWNEPENGSGQPQASASGGGVSVYIPTPPWQVGTGVPGTQGRYTPDIAFSASGHDAYFGCFAAAGASCTVQSGSFAFTGFAGTSAAAPDMAGITALLNQSAGEAQGELNSNLYRLAGTPSNNVFHDATVSSSGVTGCVVTTPSMCNNSTPSSTSQSGGLSGYLVGTGYDEVTGWGSVNVANLLANWNVELASSTSALATSQTPILVGASVKFTATVTSTTSGTPTGTVAFLDNGLLLGLGTLNASAVATLTTSALAAGTQSITARYSGDSNFAGSTSSALAEQVNNPAPTLTSLGTASISAGSAGFNLSVTGTNFVSSSVVNFNGSALSTTYEGSSTALVAAVPTSDLTTGGIFPVTVTNPSPGGGTSGSRNFTVNNPSPLLGSLSPSNATTGGAAFTLTVNGSGFVPTSVVKFNGTAETTTFVGSAQVTASIPASAIHTAGTFPVTVTNPLPGGGTSSSLNFTVSNGALSVSSATLPVGVAAVAYPSTNLAATGGNSPYTWTTTPVSGSLPPGLSLSSAGAITGTPTTAGTYPFTVKVTDSASNTATGAFSIAVGGVMFSGGPASISITQGSSGTQLVTLNALNGFNGTATLSAVVTSSPSGASGLPVLSFTTPDSSNFTSGANVLNFSAATTGNATLNVATTAATSGALNRPPADPPVNRNWPSAALAVSLAGFFFLLWGVPAPKRWGFAPLAVLLVVIVAAGAGCSSGGSANTAGNPGTTPGTYTITVTATPAPGGTQAAQTTTVTVNLMQ